ncbi:hypothetical protein HG536_0A01680 [Torulaspora globosa]|uniref:C2H2-type domain-containing protein n=1 Tax=Torulaspora globosa TaxID=48254 RepID=A0A7G3ZA15_9SACH|nr:uncharacterized protein HG536_0A01680 [Torulaspora globosa]QLL30351.1 hypothetical protein HG536_0A01680 [Torulaspora globosa]
MVLLKDILNQDSQANVDEKSSDGCSERQLDAPHSDASIDRKKSDNSLPSPTLSASSHMNSNGNVDNDGCYLTATRRSSYDSSTGGHAGTPQSELSSGSEEEHQMCRWDGCGKVFSQAELLYHHLCKDHVGRKSQKNLQLNCKWGDCQAKTEKRDHITSHLRVHIALKPFKCTTCDKNFKRPQDLKKHLKTHIESHIIFKKKRGPKIGAKRVTKKETDRRDPAKSDSASSPLNCSSSPSGQLPISLQQLVTNELPSYEPIYSEKLGARLNAVLQPIAADDDLPRSAPLATANAAHFFSALSRNMQSVRPAPAAYQEIQKPLINGEPALAAASASRSTGTGAGLLAGSLGQYPEMRPLPPIEPQFAHDRSSVLPSLSSAPLLMPRHKTFERAPHFNTPAQYYSSAQRSSGKRDTSDDQGLSDALTSLDITRELNAEEYEETLATVNLMRDYLVCLLLEDEYTDVGESAVTASPRVRISRYPQVVI